MVGLEAQGDRTSTTLAGTALSLQHQHFVVAGALVLATGVLAPVIEIGMTLYLLAVCGSGRAAAAFRVRCGFSTPCAPGA